MSEAGGWRVEAYDVLSRRWGRAGRVADLPVLCLFLTQIPALAFENPAALVLIAVTDCPGRRIVNRGLHSALRYGRHRRLGREALIEHPPSGPPAAHADRHEHAAEERNAGSHPEHGLAARGPSSFDDIETDEDHKQQAEADQAGADPYRA